MGNDRVGPPVDDLTSIEVDGSLTIYVPATERVVTLNETASAVWELLSGDLTTDEIVAQLAEAYDVSADVIHDDVVATIEQFRAEGLLSGGAGAPSRTDITDFDQNGYAE